ncbi:MAG: YggT family protein [Candidatus Puniceispirillales bacterium]|nr:YggT family protein [Pseudomonadota bacterium]
MDTHFFIALLQLVDVLVGIYVWTLLAYIISSWLIMFRIINPYQPAVRAILSGLSAIHDPILLPFRRIQYRLLPNMGGLDLSPIVTLILAQYFIGPLLKDIIILIARIFSS